MGKLLTIIFIIFPLTFGYCQDQVYTISDFSKGENSHASAYIIPDNQGTELINVRINDQYGSLSKREKLLSYGNFSNSSITGLHRYYKSDGTTKLIASTSTFLKTGNDDTGTATIIKTGLTDSKRWQFVTYKDIAIGMNGYDMPQKWDGNINQTANTSGHRTINESCAELGAPFATLRTGTDLNASSWYQYKIAFFDGSTYDFSAARSNPILTGADVYSIQLSDIPIGPSGTTNRYVYRTVGNATKAGVQACTEYFMVKNITNNTGRTWNDDVSDATANDDSAPTWATVAGSDDTNCTPPKGAYCTLHNQRLFVSGNPTYQSDIYFSDEYNPDHFLPTDYEQIRPDDGDKITFLKTYLGILTIGKTNSIQKYYTEGNKTTWVIGDAMSSMGCPAPYSASITPKGIFYLDRNGLYVFDGQKSYLVSDAVTLRIKDIAATNLPNAVGYYHNNQYLLAYSSDEQGRNLNDRVLIYNLIRDAYTVDTENINCFASFDSGSDFGTLYSGSSTTDGYIFAHSGGNSILSKRYKSDLDLGTFNDSRSLGTEDNPTVEIAWNCTIDGWLADMQGRNVTVTDINNITELENSTGAIINRPDKNGTWTSPVYQINASGLDKLYWNEVLNDGSIDWVVRLGNNTTNCAAATWNTSVTNPSGSDLSSIHADNFIQLQANLSTDSINTTPNLYQLDGYIFKLEYTKIGSAYETNITSSYKSGWKDFGIPALKKLIKRIKVFYQGTGGNLTFNYKNEEGDFNNNFTIDLSILPDISTDDEYTGDGEDKVYTHFPPINAPNSNPAVGQFWQFGLTETGITNWKIKRCEFVVEPQSLYD